MVAYGFDIVGGSEYQRREVLYDQRQMSAKSELHRHPYLFIYSLWSGQAHLNI